jgi:uncharacterized protein (TIGR03435 family)
MPNVCGAFRHLIGNPGPARVDRIEAAGVSMPLLINWLSSEVRRIVIDRTGFTQKFSCRLEFAPSEVVYNAPGATSAHDPGNAIDVYSSAPSLSYALKEELGLELKPSKGPVDVLVIDHVEQPTPD